MRVGKHTEKKQTKRQKKVFTNPTLLALFPPYSFIWHLRKRAPAVLRPCRMHLHPQIQNPNAFPAVIQLCNISYFGFPLEQFSKKNLPMLPLHTRINTVNCMSSHEDFIVPLVNDGKLLPYFQGKRRKKCQMYSTFIYFFTFCVD